MHLPNTRSNNSIMSMLLALYESQNLCQTIVKRGCKISKIVFLMFNQRDGLFALGPNFVFSQDWPQGN